MIICYDCRKDTQKKSNKIKNAVQKERSDKISDEKNQKSLKNWGLMSKPKRILE